MKTFFHPDQYHHYPRTYFSRGMLRTPLEIPDRLDPLLAAARSLEFELIAPEVDGMAEIAAVHSLPYLQFLESAHRRWQALPEDWGEEVMSNIFVREPNALRGILAEAGRYQADGSSPIGAGTWPSALASARCAVAGARAMMEGERETWALCRPPGHHARPEAAGGHCYLNNTAIAANMLARSGQRVAILDIDVHHGQGIQEIFRTRPDVYYVSTHGDPTNFYPAVAGFDDERGEGEGYGYNLNLPIPHGTSEANYFGYLAQALTALSLYQPDVLILALGFDLFEGDQQAKIRVSAEGFEQLGRCIGELALPTLIVQEGGYAVDQLEALAHYFFTGFTAMR